VCWYACLTLSVKSHALSGLERCNPWPHVANRHMSISQLLSSCCYLFTALNSGVLFCILNVCRPRSPRPGSHAHCRHRHISVADTFLNSSVKLIVLDLQNTSSCKSCSYSGSLMQYKVNSQFFST